MQEQDGNVDDSDAHAPAVSDDELATCLRVLRALATPDGGITDDFRTPRFKPLRTAMQLFLDDAASRQFHGQRPDKYAQRKEKKREKNAREQQQRALDRQEADKTRMRAERLKMLGALEESAAAAGGGGARLTLVPDGAVATDGLDGAPLLLAESGCADGEDVVVASDADAGEAQAGATTELHTLRPCYTCKKRYRLLHHFYASLCPECAELNYTKRMQTADLRGRTFLVTGARVKIGFQSAIKLLRCGATVLATSRFPADTASRFAAQSDEPSWSGRLHVYGLDLRDLASLEAFCAHLLRSGRRLDGIVNNACQTIRRPAAYYAHLLPLELEPARWTPQIQALLADHAACFASRADAPAPKPPLLPAAAAPPAEAPSAVDDGYARPAANGAIAPAVGATAIDAAATIPGALDPTWSVGAACGTGDRAPIPSALWSQAPLWSAEGGGVRQPDEGSASNFPVGMTDVNGQQLDTRRINSWLLKIEDVSTPEAAEVLAINALAPFVINSRLRGLLEACPASARFVVNVSAMEGKFYRYKTANHPHTNMAKAALNMMTRTCAEELAGCAIYMNSVDTGWINDEKPIERAAEHADRHHFQTPLDEIDAASRILDPILSVANGNAKPVHGQFLKDYHAIEW